MTKDYQNMQNLLWLAQSLLWTVLQFAKNICIFANLQKAFQKHFTAILGHYESDLEGYSSKERVNLYILEIFRECSCPVPNSVAYQNCSQDECDLCKCAPCEKGQKCAVR